MLCLNQTNINKTIFDIVILIPFLLSFEYEKIKKILVKINYSI